MGESRERREPWIVAGAFAATFLLHLVAHGLRSAAGVSYFLALTLALARGVPRALRRPRAARIAAGVVLALGAALAFESSSSTVVENERTAVLHFPDARARASEEIAVPPSWRGQGRVWAYVGVAGDVAAVLSARPVLTLDGRTLALEAAPPRVGYLRAPVLEPLPDTPVRLAFGFEAPSPDVGLLCATFFESSFDRAPSAFSADGTPPPPGPPLAPRARGLVGALAGGARFEPPAVPLGPGLAGERGLRYVLELWLVSESGEVLATRY